MSCRRFAEKKKWPRASKIRTIVLQITTRFVRWRYTRHRRLCHRRVHRCCSAAALWSPGWRSAPRTRCCGTPVGRKPQSAWPCRRRRCALTARTGGAGTADTTAATWASSSAASSGMRRGTRGWSTRRWAGSAPSWSSPPRTRAPWSTGASTSRRPAASSSSTWKTCVVGVRKKSLNRVFVFVSFFWKYPFVIIYFSNSRRRWGVIQAGLCLNDDVRSFELLIVVWSYLTHFIRNRHGKINLQVFF